MLSVPSSFVNGAQPFPTLPARHQLALSIVCFQRSPPEELLPLEDGLAEVHARLFRRRGRHGRLRTPVAVSRTSVNGSEGFVGHIPGGFVQLAGVSVGTRFVRGRKAGGGGE